MIVPNPVFVPAKRRVRRRRRARAAAATPGFALVSAAYEPGVALTLTFGRAVDPACVAGLDVMSVVVTDGVAGQIYTGSTAPGSATLVGPAVLRLGLMAVAPCPAGGVTLSAPATTGIVALEGGEAWAGVSELPLPYP